MVRRVTVGSEVGSVGLTRRLVRRIISITGVCEQNDQASGWLVFTHMTPAPLNSMLKENRVQSPCEISDHLCQATGAAPEFSIESWGEGGDV